MWQGDSVASLKSGGPSRNKKCGKFNSYNFTGQRPCLPNAHESTHTMKEKDTEEERKSFYSEQHAHIQST